MTAEHEQSAKVVADAKAEHDRIAAETAIAQQSYDALKQQVAQLNDTHEQAAKAVADAKAERDRIVAETVGVQQSEDALKQRVAQLNDQLAGGKTEQTGLDRQVGDLRANLADLTAEHEQAAKAVADAKAERDRIAAETATAQQSYDALKQQVAQLNDTHEQAAKAVADAKAERDRIAAETATAQQSYDALKQQVARLNDQILNDQIARAGLDKQVGDLRATLATLTAEREQAAKIIANAKVERDRVAGETVAARPGSAPQLVPENTSIHVLVSYTPRSAAAMQDAAELVRLLRDGGLSASDPAPAARVAGKGGITYFFAEDRDGAMRVEHGLGQMFWPSRLLSPAPGEPLPRPGTIEVLVPAR